MKKLNIMKNLLFTLALLISVVSFSSIEGTEKTETNPKSALTTNYKGGCHLYGKIKIVEYGEDYKVKFVDYGEDLKIKYVSYGENKVGNWKLVSYGEAYKVKIVEYGEDYKIKDVEYGQGCD